MACLKAIQIRKVSLAILKAFPVKNGRGFSFIPSCRHTFIICRKPRILILFASVRYDGLSLTEIAGRETGKTAGRATIAAGLFIIITALAGLSPVVANALAESFWGTFSIASPKKLWTAGSNNI
jgi:hypothetical protein